MSNKKKDNVSETEQEIDLNEEVVDCEVITPEEKPKSEVEKLKKENEELKDKYLRTLAEFDNFRRRTQKEKEGLYKDAKAVTITGLLPLVDNLERALVFNMDASAQDINKGVQMILAQLKEYLTSLDIKEIGVQGETFDPERHNAVMCCEDPEKGEKEITDVFEKGYMLGDRVLRYAMVKVAN